MATTKKIPARKIIIGLVVAFGLTVTMILLVIVALRWVSFDVSWTQKIPPEHQAGAPRVLSSEDSKNIGRIEPRVQPYFEEALGTLKASTRTEISARVLAPIQRMLVRAGQTVREGDDLVILDRRGLETQRSQAQASLVSAQAALDKDEKDFRRAEELIKKRIISKEAYDEAKARVEVARANLDYAQQSLAGADVDLSYTVIKAPKSGIIVDRLAEEGNMAQPGVPLLTLYDPTSLRLEVPVMENLAVKLHPGDKLKVKIDTLGRTVDATVDEIVPQAQAASRSFLVKVALPKSPGLFEGMFGRLIIPGGRRLFLCMPIDAVQRIGQLEFVDVVRDDNTLERRFITTGRAGRPDPKTHQPTHIEVLSGLSAGEKVLIRKPGEKEAP